MRLSQIEIKKDSARKHRVTILVSLLAVTLIALSLIIWNMKSSVRAGSGLDYCIFTEGIAPGKKISDVWFRGQNNNPYCEDVSDIVWYKSNDNFATETQITDPNETFSYDYLYRAEVTWTQLNFNFDSSTIDYVSFFLKDIYSDMNYLDNPIDKFDETTNPNGFKVLSVDADDKYTLRISFPIGYSSEERSLKLYYANEEVKSGDNYVSLSGEEKLIEEAKLTEVSDYKTFWRIGLDLTKVFIGCSKSDALCYSKLETDGSTILDDNIKVVNFLHYFEKSDEESDLTKNSVLNFYGKNIYVTDMGGWWSEPINDCFDIKHYSFREDCFSLDVSFVLTDRPVMERVEGDPVRPSDKWVGANIWGENLTDGAYLYEIPDGVSKEEYLQNWAYYIKAAGVPLIPGYGIGLVNDESIDLFSDDYYRAKMDDSYYEFSYSLSNWDLPDSEKTLLVFQLLFNEDSKVVFAGEPITFTVKPEIGGAKTLHYREIKNDTRVNVVDSYQSHNEFRYLTLNNENNANWLFSKELEEAIFSDPTGLVKPFEKGSSFNILYSAYSEVEPTSLNFTGDGRSDFKDVTLEYDSNLYDVAADLDANGKLDHFPHTNDEVIEIESALSPYINKWGWKKVYVDWMGQDVYVIYAYVTVEFPDENIDPPGGGGSSSGSREPSFKIANMSNTCKEIATAAKKGSKITVYPFTNRKVSEVLVTDKKGNKIDVTQTSESTFTFKMPSSDVTVEVKYEEREILLFINKLVAYVDKTEKELDTTPILRNDRTMLPIRFVAENLDAEVIWDEEGRTATITEGETKIVITIGSNKVLVNDKEYELDVVPFIENDRTYLPVRFVSEHLNAKVDWYEPEKKVTITKK